MVLADAGFSNLQTATPICNAHKCVPRDAHVTARAQPSCMGYAVASVCFAIGTCCVTGDFVLPQHFLFMSYQFPPSSPLAHEDVDQFESFKRPRLIDARGRYPTPNPSSATGRSSSPVREKEPVAQDSRNVSFKLPSTNKDFNIISPDTTVLRVPLLASKSSVLIGRSSKSCDFHFRTPDKTVSRTHLKVDYSADSITITCLGYNGLAMRVPRPCHVSAGDKPGHYVLSDAERPLDASQLKFTPRTILLDNNHTEFAVNRNEAVTMPRIYNVMVEIRDNVLLINPLDEDATDEENEVEAVAAKPKSILKKTVQGQPARHAPAESAEAIPTSVESAKAESKEVVASTLEETAPTPVKPVEAVAATPEPKKIFVITPEEPTPSKSFTIFEEKVERLAGPRPSTPLQDRTNFVSMTPPPTKKVVEDTPKRRSQSEEPAVKPKKPKAAHELVIDHDCIKSLANVAEISNILVNHLAFSRLSLTPASFLNTISAVVLKISLSQLRTILDEIPCIGVIYREGKDAAGKPLEEEYYYIPEKDDDPERPALVSSIKGHGGLRSCRRTHKQYYWKKPAPKKKN